MGETSLTMFGMLLVFFMIAAIFYYFAGKRKRSIEEPKFEMLKDEDDDKTP